MPFIVKKTSKGINLSHLGMSACVYQWEPDSMSRKITYQSAATFFTMVILAELGHVINVNKAREGIKCHQNNAHMLTFQWSLIFFFYRNQD